MALVEQPFPMKYDALEPRRKKVAIVGFSPHTLYEAPFADETWEVWGMNQLYRYIPRGTRWFEIHTRTQFIADTVRDTNYLAWLQACPLPVYMVQRFDDIPQSIEYPKAEILQQFGIDREGTGDKEGYFASTISWQLALAILEGFETIGLWGIDLVADEEYIDQKPSASFLLGWARGLGIALRLPAKSALLRGSYLYGYEEPPHRDLLVKLIERRNALFTRRQDLQTELNAVDGALQENEQWMMYVNKFDRGLKLQWGQS